MVTTFNFVMQDFFQDFFKNGKKKKASKLVVICGSNHGKRRQPACNCPEQRTHRKASQPHPLGELPTVREGPHRGASLVQLAGQTAGQFEPAIYTHLTSSTTSPRGAIHKDPKVVPRNLSSERQGDLPKATQQKAELTWEP
jgi:hypothetical protein